MSEVSFFRREQEKQEAKPHYRLMITRHAERLPDGSLAPEGIESVNKKGAKLAESAEIIKGYASDEKTKRTVITSEYISGASETTSPMSEEPYKTRERRDIQYASVFIPDLIDLLDNATKIIDAATVEELGLPEGTILKELPKEQQRLIAPIRQKNQELGFISLLQNPEAVHRMALGMAALQTREMGIANRYAQYREYKKKPLKKDAILNTVTHGMFSEALFIEAGFIRGKDGAERRITKDDFQTAEFGGFIMPSESFSLEIGEDPDNIPDRIPVSFERDGRPEDGVVIIDKKRLFELTEEYKKWRGNQN